MPPKRNRSPTVRPFSASVASAPMPMPKLLGSGEDGCVFDSFPVTCNERLVLSKVKYDQYVTKVSGDRASFDREVIAAKRLATVDPHQAFTIYPVSACAKVQRPTFAFTCPPVQKLLATAPLFTLEMPYVDGKTLTDVVAASRGTYPWATVVSWMEELASRIQLLHANGIYHKDLHHGNVWIVGDRIKIADFGWAVVDPEDKVRGTTLSDDVGKSVPAFQALWSCMDTDAFPKRTRTSFEFLRAALENNTLATFVNALHQWTEDLQAAIAAMPPPGSVVKKTGAQRPLMFDGGKPRSRPKRGKAAI